MNIMIDTQIAGCGPVTFDNVALALEFVRMLAHQIVPDQFISLVKALVPNPEGVKHAQELVKACMGSPA